MRHFQAGPLTLVVAACCLSTAFAASVPIRSAEVSGKQLKIVLADGRELRVPPEADQAGVAQIRLSGDRRTAGWLVDYVDPGSPTYRTVYAGTLVIWSNGRVERRFVTGQAFYAWAFVDGDSRLSFHSGPTHGERKSHCELHDIATGKEAGVWDGDLDSDAQLPGWALPLRDAGQP